MSSIVPGVFREFYQLLPQDEAKYDPATRQSEQDEITRLISRIDVSALLSRASDLREGIACSTPDELEYMMVSRSPVMRGMNYHVEIMFEDGVSWQARIRRFNTTSPPVDLRNHIMRSEVVILKLLSGTSVPVPAVFDFNLDGTNTVGVGYILMEKLPGRSLRLSIATPEQRN